MQDAIDMSTTHIVVIPPANCQMPTLSPADLLQHLHHDMGSTAGLTALHKLLAAGQVHIVQRRCAEHRTAACTTFVTEPGSGFSSPLFVSRFLEPV